MVTWPTRMGKCMAFTDACVLSKWFWQQKIFSGYLQGERQLRSVLPMFTLDWDLFSLVFFSFPISSDLKPGRIILTCLKAIFNLTLSFSSSPMNVNHRANIQGQLIQPTPRRAERKTFSCSPLLFLLFFSSSFPFKKLFLVQRMLWCQGCHSRCGSCKSLFCRSLPLTFTPSWVPIWRAVFLTLPLRLRLRCLELGCTRKRTYVKWLRHVKQAGWSTLFVSIAEGRRRIPMSREGTAPVDVSALWPAIPVFNQGWPFCQPRCCVFRKVSVFVHHFRYPLVCIPLWINW